MKPQFFLTCFALALVALLSDCSCGKTPAKPDARIDLLNKLKGSWKASDVTVDGTTRTTDYKDFILKIDGNDNQAIAKFPFEAQNRPKTSVWDSKGELWFKEGNNSILQRSDNVVGDITYTLTDGDKTLNLEFKWPTDKAGYTTGRVQSVGGTWKFKLSKQ